MDFLSLISTLNTSKYFSGVLMILMNLGSKYVGLELSEFQDEFLSKKIIRRLIIFCIFFVATRDIIISIILTGIFIIFIGGIFNDNSKFSIIKKYNPKTKVITREDLRKAKKIINKYEKQEMKRRNQNIHPSPSPK
tara:strand:+ start:335 stop:742 length:408 start_codon:yes stop_codon:yes gene_type:complete